MDEELPEKIRWDADFKRRVAGGVVSGLILLAFTGMAGVIVTQVGSLSAHDALLYVGLPVVVVVALGLAVVVIRAQRQRAAERQAWERDISLHVIAMANVVRRMILKDLIHTAQVWEWTVGENDVNDLVFIAPDDEAVVVVDDTYPNMDDVAGRLHEAAPDHFPETWNDFTYSAHARADMAVEASADLGERLGALEQSLLQRLTAAYLAEATREAKDHGWMVVWSENSVRFERGDDVATIRYRELDEIDVPKLVWLVRQPVQD